MRVCRTVRSIAAAAALLAGSMVTSGTAMAGPSVYLMRGLFDVSTGLDQLAASMRKRGIAARVDSYTASDQLAAAAIKEWKSGKTCPIVIVGHSLGSDAAIAMAGQLGRAGVPVALIASFSPAHEGAVPSNVARVVNYYQSNSTLWPNRLGAGGRKIPVRNVDLANEAGVDHFNIEKIPRLHAEIMRLVAAAAGSCKSPSQSAAVAKSGSPVASGATAATGQTEAH